MSSELSAAIEASRSAGEAIMGYFAKPLARQKKGPIDFVTEADLKSQEIIVDTLSHRFNYEIVSEESEDQRLRNGRYWLVDPLDGTTNFLHGYPLFAVSIALVDEGAVQLGVVFDPLHDDLYTAERGNGTQLNNAPIRVSGVELLSEAVVATGFPYDAWTCPEDPAREAGAFLRKVVTLRCDGSAALDLCHVASGRIDGYWERRLEAWDMAGGSLIVQEAGGRVSTARGISFTVGAESIVASNLKIHKEMLHIIDTCAGPTGEGGRSS